MAVDEHGLWVRRDRKPSLLIDPVSGQLKGTVVTGYELPLCQGIGAAYDVVYICRGTDLLRVDPTTMEVRDRVKLHKEYAQGHIPGAFGRFWVLESDGSTLTGLDPATGAVVSSFKLPARGWDRPPARTASGWPARSTTRCYRGGPGDAEVNAPETGEVLATVEGGAEPDGDIASDERYVYVRNGEDFLLQIDKATNGVLRYTADLEGGGSVAVAAGDVWVTGFDDATLMRLWPDAG